VETILGTTGTDIVKLVGTTSVSVSDIETVLGSTGADVVTMLSTGTLKVSSVDTVLGTGGGDTITLLNAGSVSLSDVVSVIGSSGNDIVTLLGSGTSVVTTLVETVLGTSGADTIVVLDGAYIKGGDGADTLTGGSGIDHFVYTSPTQSAVGAGDTITNFDANKDILVFGPSMKNGTFSFIGDSSVSFHGIGNSEARFDDTTKVLQIDFNGNGSVDMEITLTGVSLANLSNADFLWS